MKEKEIVGYLKILSYIYHVIKNKFGNYVRK